jgi:Trypsin-like peptidase domain
MRFTLMSLVFGTAICFYLPHPSLAQAQSVSLTSDSAAHDLAHGMEHAAQIESILGKASEQQKHDFTRQVGIAMQTKFAPQATNLTLPETARNIAEQVSKVETAEDLRHLVATLQPLGITDTQLVSLIQTAVQTQEQVLETKAPVFSIGRPTPIGTPTTLTQLSCPSAYPGLSAKVQESAPKLSTLFRSVARIEVIEPGKDPSSKGTAFVVDQARGLVATACHVVDEIADLDPEAGNWTLPRKATPSAVVLVDFADTSAHNSLLEFKVDKVAYVPNVTGCDGAILQVATTNDKGGLLPVALSIAKQEPTIAPGSQLQVVSIGYPDLTNLGGTTTDTLHYFECVTHNSNKAKFFFGGSVTSDELMGGYHLQTHAVPTTGGQSGSPIIDISDPGNPAVIGIHICCVVGVAHVTNGAVCALRNEPYMEESVSALDLMKMFDASQDVRISSLGTLERSSYKLSVVQ